MKNGYRVNTAEIVCVGTELLIGDIVNTNAAYLSQKLAGIGVNQYHQQVVGDNPARLTACLTSALSRVDLVILTGGLGPTKDDLTKETAASVMGRELIVDAEATRRLESYFVSRRSVMTGNNRKQALVPSGSVVFQNDAGTAPGMAIEDEENGKIVMLLPGPPRELRPMFEQKALPYLSRFVDGVFFSRNVNICGMGESKVAHILDAIIENGSNPTVAPYACDGEVRLRVTARGKSEEECAALCDLTVEKIRRTPVGEFIYGIDTTLEEAAVKRLAGKRLTLTVSEKATGGLICRKITSIPEQRDVFTGGVVLPGGERSETPSTEELLQEKKGEETLARTEADVALVLGDFCLSPSDPKERAVSCAVCARGRKPRVETFFIRDNGADYLRECASKRALSLLLKALKDERPEASE